RSQHTVAHHQLIIYLFLFFFERSAHHRNLHSFPTRRSSDLRNPSGVRSTEAWNAATPSGSIRSLSGECPTRSARALSAARNNTRSEEHTSELQSLAYLVCRLLLEKKKKKYHHTIR